MDIPMRERKFIEQNKQKWREFERTLESNRKDPDKLSNLFVQITDDLSYSRTFYPNRSVRVYLNNLAQKVFYSIYKNIKPCKTNIYRVLKCISRGGRIRTCDLRVPNAAR